MDNIIKANPIEKLVSFYLIAISVIYTFYYMIYIDNYVGSFIVLCAFLLILSRHNKAACCCASFFELP